MVRILLEKGACQRQDALQQALYLAISRGWPRIAQIPMDNSAKPVLNELAKRCHLRAAVKYGQPDMLRLLLDAKAVGWKAASDLGICKEIFIRSFSWI